MMRPDMIVVTPTNLDFPKWRELIRRCRDRFNQIINVFHPTNRGYDFSGFIREKTPEAIHLEMPKFTSGDWRSIAVNEALRHSKADRVLFFEQDFQPRTWPMTAMLNRALDADVDVVGFNYEDCWEPGKRLHPAFLLVKRSRIERTSRNFGVTEAGDHFTKFSDELHKQGPIYTTLERLGLRERESWYHYNGVSHNFSLLQEGKPVTYKPDEFAEYLDACVRADVAQHPDFLATAKRFLESR